MKLARFKPHLGLLLTLLLYLAITGYTSWRAPLADGPDEVAHFMFARFLQKEGYLPLTPEDRTRAGYKSDQPPLYAALVAGVFFWGDLTAPPFVKLTQGIPRRHLVLDGGVDQHNVNSPQVLNTADPLAGEFLFWRFGRLGSIIFSGATLVVIYALALKIFADRPDRHGWALATVMSVAFIPTFVFISGVFSYESLLGLWLALYLLVAVHLLSRSEARWLYLLAGLFIGLAIVTKLSALPTPLSLIGLTLVIGYRAGWSKGAYLSRLAWGCLGLLIGAGWWLALIELKLNRVAELGWLAGLLQPFLGDGSDPASLQLAYLLSEGKVGSTIRFSQPGDDLNWAFYLFQTFWTLRLKGPAVALLLMALLSGLMIIGLIRLGRCRPETRLGLVFLTFHALLFLILPSIRFMTTGLTTAAGQGHHLLFPAVGAWAILMTEGLGAWWPARLTRPWLGGMVLGLGLLGWSIAQAGQIYHAPPLPVRTVPPVAPASAHKVELDFGPLALKGYELAGLADGQSCCRADQPALGVKLYWLAEEFMTEDYLTRLSLVDSQGESQSIWLGHAANGRYPTRAWEPGDIIHDDLWLPLVGLAPGRYTLELELEGAQAPLVSQAGRSGVTLTQINLAQGPPAVVKDRAGAGQVWQAGQVMADWPVFESRATIQITADPGEPLRLVGPDQVAHEPQAVAGQTYVFIVDPLWSSGAYQVWAGPDDPPAGPPTGRLVVRLADRQKAPPASQTVVQANFADQIMLLGYNLPQRHLHPGERLPVTLHWQALRTLPTDFIMFTRLRDRSGQVWGGYDRWPRETYSPLLWVAGEVVEDGFTIDLDPATPAGLYELDVGFYLPVGKSAVSLPLVQAGQMSEVTSVTIGPVKVGQVSLPGLLTERPQPQVPLDQPVGEGPKLTLLGYDLAESSSHLTLTLYWRCEAPLSLDYTTFVHVRNGANETVAQQDQPPLAGAYPTSLWSAGEIIADEITMPLPAERLAEAYSIVIGMYDFKTGQRLMVPGNPANEVTLAGLDIGSRGAEEQRSEGAEE